VLALNLTRAMGTSTVVSCQSCSICFPAHHLRKILSNTWQSAALYPLISTNSSQRRARSASVWTAEFDDVPSPALFDLGDVELEEVV
jgi:hypothetical protein